MRRLLATSAALALLAGCGGTSDDEAPSSRPGKRDATRLARGLLLTAAKRTALEETIRSRFELVAEARDVPGGLRIHGVATATPDTRRMRVTTTYTLSGLAGITDEAILRGQTIWVRSKDPLSGLPPGTWVRTTDDELPPTALTPAQCIELVREAKNVKAVAIERIRRRTTTHYRGTVRYGEMLKRLAPKTRRIMRRYASPKLKVSLHVWTDKQGLLRRLGMYYRQRRARILFTEDMLAYDVPLNAAAPDPATVVEMGSLPPVAA